MSEKVGDSPCPVPTRAAREGNVPVFLLAPTIGRAAQAKSIVTRQVQRLVGNPPYADIRIAGCAVVALVCSRRHYAYAVSAVRCGAIRAIRGLKEYLAADVVTELRQQALAITTNWPASVRSTFAPILIGANACHTGVGDSFSIRVSHGVIETDIAKRHYIGALVR